MNPTKEPCCCQYCRENPEPETFEVLHDVSLNGEERPWKLKRLRSLKVAASFERLGKTKLAERIRECGIFLEFHQAEHDACGVFHSSYFCKKRFCAMCQWRLSRRMAYVLSNIMVEVETSHNELVPLFFTSTVRNPVAMVEALTDALNMMLKGWNRFVQVGRIKSAVKGWFRSFELTYNREEDTFHPHIHAIILVDKSYFHSADYMKHAEWRVLWARSLRLNYLPQVRIQAIDDAFSSILEVSKYAVKDSDFIFDDDEKLTDRLLSVLSKALYKRRFTAYGGIMKKIAVSLNMLDKEGDEDLIHTGDGVIGDGKRKAILYRWYCRFSEYFKVAEWMLD
jgi:plasmid rolling circle replication initiator protein Rep